MLEQNSAKLPGIGLLSQASRVLPIVPVLSAFTLGLTPVSKADESPLSTRPTPSYDLSGKPLDMGTLDYLRSIGLITDERVQSCYTLPVYSGSSDGFVVTKFEVTETIRYYDPDTGLSVEPEDMDPNKNYSAVTFKDFTSHEYEMEFKQYSFGFVPEADDTNTSESGSLPPETGDLEPQEPAPEIRTLSYDVEVIGRKYTFDYTYVVGDPRVVIGQTDKSGKTGPKHADLWTKDANGKDCIEIDFIDNVGDVGGAALNIGNDNTHHQIGTIKGNFINNHVTGRAGDDGGEGGAIWIWGGSGNDTHIENIIGNFIGNYISGIADNGSTTQKNNGAALFHAGDKLVTDNIIGSFFGNHIDNVSSDNQRESACGAALYNGDGATIHNIYADFVGNHSDMPTDGGSDGAGGHGGAIYNGNQNTSTIDAIYGDFIGNYVDASRAGSTNAWGGAITNQRHGYIGSITGDFIGNYVKAHGSIRRNASEDDGAAGGGAIYNNRAATIDTITGNFIGNYCWIERDRGYKDDETPAEMGKRARAAGGAIYNFHNNDENISSVIENIFGSFYGNYVRAEGDATAEGGAIGNYKDGLINYIDGDFIGNYAYSTKGIARGGAIYSDDKSVIKLITGSFYNNWAKSGEKDKLHPENEEFSGFKAFGGAIRNQGHIERIENGIFVGNYATSYGYSRQYHEARDNYMKAYMAYRSNPTQENYDAMMRMRDEYDLRDTYKYALGGAIFNQAGAKLTIAANNGTSLFEGNYTENIIAPTKADGSSDKTVASLTRVDEAVFADTSSELTLDSTNFGHIIFNDIINGNDYDVIITGDASSYVTFNNAVNRAVIELTKTNLVLYRNPAAGYNVGTDTYLPGIIREFYKHSDALRQSSLDAKSGTVILSDGETTEYLIGTLKAEDTIFTVDVDLTKTTYDKNGNELAMADILTVFGVKDSLDDPIDKWRKTERADGRENVSCSTGVVNVQLSIKGPESWSKDEEYKGNSEKNPIYVQILNFVVMEGIHGTSADKSLSAADGYWDDDYYENFRDEKNCKIKLALPENIENAYSKMYSSDTIAASIEMATIKTFHDSIKITGWRDNLAAWAELNDQDKDCWLSEIQESVNDKKENAQDYDDVEDKKKLFVLRSATHHLSRDTENDDSSPLNTVWGDDWTIMGESQEGSRLDMQHHNLLTEVDEGKTGALRNFTLLNLGKEGNSRITNNGNFTLDTMVLESTLTVENRKELTLSGIMTVNNTITTASSSARATMFINDQSEVFLADENSNAIYGEANDEGAYRIKTVLDITGSVERQNITHSGQLLDADSKEFSTLTNLDKDNIAKFKDNSLTMQGGKFQMLDMGTTRLSLRELHVDGGMIYVGSSTINLYKRIMGGIDAQVADYGNKPAQIDDDDTPSAPSVEGVIWLEDINLVGDTYRETWVRFVDSGVANTVEADNIHNHTFWGAIQEYRILYNKNEDQQYNDHPLGSFSIIPTKNINPVVQAGAVTQLAGSYVSMMQVYDYAFMHADLYSASLYNARKQRLYSNRYSVVAAKGKGSVIESDPCPATTAGMNRGLWLRTYASHETMPLRNGPTVQSNMYGGLIGGDTDLREHSSGWASVYSLYGGYIGSTQKYDSVRTKQNGGIIGATATFYKQNFYTALTISGGTSNGNTSSRYGHEDFHLLMGGIASRTGYNIEFGDGRYVLQPTLMVSYTCFSVYDYTNAAGVKMDAHPTHVVQLHPYIKLTRNTDCTWKPYASVGYVHDIMSKTKFKANDIKLPALSIKPYVEYSLGVQRTWYDKYTLYLQATGRSGGRRGVEASMGIRTTF